MLRSGDPWGIPTDEAPDLTITGTDADLAAAVAGCPAPPLVAWTPTTDSDLARAVGRAPGTDPSAGTAGSMDSLATDLGPALNALVWGASPARLSWWDRAVRVRATLDGRCIWQGRATTVVVANGEFVDGVPIAPKAHPGDGLLDVVVVGLTRGPRRRFRERLRLGDHLPHPGITTGRGRTLHLVADRPLPVHLDLVAGPSRSELTVRIESDSWRVLL